MRPWVQKSAVQRKLQQQLMAIRYSQLVCGGLSCFCFDAFYFSRVKSEFGGLYYSFFHSPGIFLSDYLITRNICLIRRKLFSYKKQIQENVKHVIGCILLYSSFYNTTWKLLFFLDCNICKLSTCGVLLSLLALLMVSLSPRIMSF